MKKIRILALILIAALAAGIFASCGEESTEITVTLIIDADDETTFFDNKVTIDVPNPTVMNVVKEVMIMYPEVPIVLNANEDSIKDVGEVTVQIRAENPNYETAESEVTLSCTAREVICTATTAISDGPARRRK